MRFAAALLGVLIAPLALADDLAGTFRGEIWSSGAPTAGTTIFSIADDGTISGIYLFGGAEATEPGTLTGCRLEARLLRCLWTDSYGSGDFQVLFAPAFDAFDGAWFPDSQDGFRDTAQGNRWTGTKTTD